MRRDNNKRQRMELPETHEELTLKKLRSIILKHNSLSETFNRKKNDMKGSIEELLKQWYESKLTQQYLHSYSRKIEKNEECVRGKVLCKNTKNYLGALFIYIKGLVIPLRTDPALLRLLVDSIETAGVSYEDSALLAEEFVNLLFIDFNSDEMFNALFLNHIDALFAVIFSKFKGELHDSVLKPINFITQMLEAFLKNVRVRSYTKKLFGKALNFMAESLQGMTCLGIEATGREELKWGPAETSESSSLKEVEGYQADHFAAAKGVADGDCERHDIGGMNSEMTIKVLETILEGIEGQLENMPLEIRFMCKLIERHTGTFEAAKKLIVDFLFHKWWNIALLNWREHFLVDLCTTEPCFAQRILLVQKLLKAVFHSPADSPAHSFSVPVKKYIESKKEFSDNYIRKLLNVRCPEFKASGNGVVSVESVCISYSALKIIVKALSTCIEEVKKLNSSYETFIKRIKDAIATDQIVKKSKSNLFGNPIDILHNNSPEDIEYEPYFLFQDINFREDEREVMFSENWQRVLASLLLRVDFSFQPDSSENRQFLRLLSLISKQPQSFALSANAVEVELLTVCVLDFFKDKSEAFTTASIEALGKSYRQKIAELNNRVREAEGGFEKIRRGVERETRRLAESNEDYIEDVIAGVVANKVVTGGAMPFKVVAEGGKKARKEVYSLVFYEMHKSGLKVSTLYQQLFPKRSTKGRVIIEGNSIKDLANNLLKVEDISSFSPESNNVDNLKSIYNTFTVYLDKSLPKLAKELPNNLKEVARHVDNYVAHSLHEIQFFNAPSENDKLFLAKIKGLKSKEVVSSLAAAGKIPNELLEPAVEKLKESSALRTPKAKLRVYREVRQLVDWWLEVLEIPCNSGQVAAISMVHAEPPHIVSDVEFVERFEGGDEKCLADIKFAIKFLNNI